MGIRNTYSKCRDDEHIINWLVVASHLKNISQLPSPGGMILAKPRKKNRDDFPFYVCGYRQPTLRHKYMPGGCEYACKFPSG